MAKDHGRASRTTSSIRALRTPRPMSTRSRSAERERRRPRRPRLGNVWGLAAGMDEDPGTDLGALAWFLGLWVVMIAGEDVPVGGRRRSLVRPHDPAQRPLLRAILREADRPW